MTLVAAIILGLVQGLTEFIPVSSSGHMIIADRVFNLNSDFKFDVLLNIGTLLALMFFYRKTIMQLLRSIFVDRAYNLAGLLVIATIPAIVIGYSFGDQIENSLQSPWVVVVMLALVGLLMIMPLRRVVPRSLQKLGWARSLAIGFAQALALVPGTSRSGITILAGQSAGMHSRDAATFSFMLAIPTIAGATAKVALSSDGRAFVADNIGLIVVGNIVSFVAGSLAISFLINTLTKRGLAPFGWYRLGLSALLIVLLFANIV